MARIIGLNHFQIKGNGSPADQHECKVYKNGRQQFQVDIVIEAYAEGGVIVPLSKDQLESVRLINYDSGAVVDSQFSRSATKNVYEFYGAPPPSRTGSVKQNMSAITFFMSVPASANFAQMQIAAEITLDGATYRTNARDSAPGGHVDKGKFNSSILVAPLAAYLLSARDFWIAYLGHIGYGYPAGGSGDNRYFFRWEIMFRNANFRILGSDISDTAYPTNCFSQFVRAGGNKDTRHWALPVRGVGQQADLGAAFEGTNIHDVFVLPYDRHGAAYAIHEEASWLADQRYTSKKIMYIDQNGCGHYVYLLPNNNGTTFQLSDTATGVLVDSGASM
ncbi:hypothetical protein [Pseudomonas sp. efr-133-TYG-103a]|uniref:hypothetical protein n=1 Tax=Pseudomonas sp. efr-133-TYG-103a TaxID=3040308 RepID=UPI00255296CD|nr:hypothetical protein [Pseudomonas sp. efr-133-TYG-103a]